MTVAPFSPPVRKRGGKRIASSKFGHNYYTVPTEPLSKLLHTFQDQLTDEYTSGVEAIESRDVGWQRLLAMRMARTLKTTPDAMERRLHDIICVKSNVTKAELADAALLAVGIRIEATDIPVLPGNKTDALDLVLIRAEEQGVTLNDLEARRLARVAHRVAAMIARYPHKTERLLDLAPFDCLRPRP